MIFFECLLTKIEGFLEKSEKIQIRKNYQNLKIVFFEKKTHPSKKQSWRAENIPVVAGYLVGYRARVVSHFGKKTTGRFQLIDNGQISLEMYCQCIELVENEFKTHTLLKTRNYLQNENKQRYNYCNYLLST